MARGYDPTYIFVHDGQRHLVDCIFQLCEGHQVHQTCKVFQQISLTLILIHGDVCMAKKPCTHRTLLLFVVSITQVVASTWAELAAWYEKFCKFVTKVEERRWEKHLLEIERIKCPPRPPLGPSDWSEQENPYIPKEITVRYEIATLGKGTWRVSPTWCRKAHWPKQ